MQPDDVILTKGYGVHKKNRPGTAFKDVLRAVFLLAAAWLFLFGLYQNAVFVQYAQKIRGFCRRRTLQLGSEKCNVW